MKPRTKRFLATLLSLCLLGTTSLPVAAISSSKGKTPDSFYEDVRELVSDYWSTGAQEISPDSCPTMRLMVQSTQDIDGNALGAVRTLSDGQGWYILQFDSEGATQAALKQLSEWPEVLSIEEDQFVSLEEEPLESQNLLEIQDKAAESSPLQLAVQSAQNIDGDALGAVRTLSDGKGRYVLQFDSEDARQAALEQLSQWPEVSIEEQIPAQSEGHEKTKGSLESKENQEAFETVEETARPEDTTPENTHLSWGAQRLGIDSWVSQMSEAQKNRPITVAVLDTGINDHPLFGGRMQEGIRLIDTSTGDVRGHGTHVAGIIADMTQGTQTQLVSVKVLGDNGKGTLLLAANGLRWAMEHGADVVNMSLIGDTHSYYLESAIRQAIKQNIVVVAAAGNKSADTSGFCPADVPELLCVSAISNKPTDSMAYFSNFGDSVDLAAPGVGIVSALNNGKTGTKTGTSMAAPHVAGAAALVKAVRPDASALRIGKILTDASDDRGEPGWDSKYGYGVVNLSNLSVQQVETLRTQPPVSPEKENISVSYDTIFIKNLPDTVDSVILQKENRHSVPEEQKPSNGAVTFQGLRSSTDYTLSYANLDGVSAPLTIRTEKKTPDGSGKGSSSSGNKTVLQIPAQPTPKSPEGKIPAYAAADLLDTKQVNLSTNKAYQFLVKNNHDAKNIRIEVEHPALLDVQLIDANDPRGAKYQINPKAVGNTTVNVIYEGQIASISVTISSQKQASLTLDTTSYTMKPGGQYTVGASLRDKDGSQLTAEQVNALLAEKRLVIRDSRTGSVFDLTQLPGGNVQITGKQTGVGYLLYEIDGVHISVRIIVADNAKAQGDSTRNTLYF